MANEQRKEFRTSVILTREQQVQLERIAEQNDTSIAWVIRQAVNRYLEHQDDATRTIEDRRRR